MAYDFDLGAVDIGWDGDYDLGAPAVPSWARMFGRNARRGPSRPRPNTNALRARILAEAQAREQARASRLASAIGANRPAITAQPFVVSAAIFETETSGQGTERPLSGMNPQSANLVSYTSGGTPATGVDLLNEISCGNIGMFLSPNAMPIASVAPDSFKAFLSFPPLTPATPVTMRTSRTIAPGAAASGAEVTTALTIFGTAQS